MPLLPDYFRRYGHYADARRHTLPMPRAFSFRLMFTPHDAAITP